MLREPDNDVDIVPILHSLDRQRRGTVFSLENARAFSEHVDCEERDCD